METPWRAFVFANDVVMIPLDSQATLIDLSSAAMQIAQGSPTNDADGTRQATVLFPTGTGATMTLPDGSTQSLTALTVRATEYTVGDNGLDAMPGELPPTSGYTYAVELRVDEALAAGATRVDFDQTLALYVDNFLGFPTGETVPVGVVWTASARRGYRQTTAASWRYSASITVERNWMSVAAASRQAPKRWPIWASRRTN